jgi:hypothetical protein
MPLWANTDAAAASVKYGSELTRAGVSGQHGSGNAAKAANTTALYGNTTVAAVAPARVVGQFAVTIKEMANTSASGERNAISHSGWNMRYAGTGPVTAIVVPGAGTGTGYSNLDLIKISGGTTNATGTLVTNSTGGIISANLTLGGAGFVNTSATTVAVTNTTGGTANGSAQALTVTLGGRAGRVTYETITTTKISSTGNSIPFHT